MTRETNEIDQAVSRTLRDSLEKIQRTADELNQAVSDLISACASTRPANSLSPMLRAQTSAASLGASLEVLARFVTHSLRPAVPESTFPISEPALNPPAPQQPESPVMQQAEPVAGTPAPAMDVTFEKPWEPIPQSPLETVAPFSASEIVEPRTVESVASGMLENAVGDGGDTAPASFTDVPVFSGMPADAALEPSDPFPHGFDLANLSLEEQELHRRANRVAKVSMQDIKLLRPDDVRLGQENRDLCFRLRDDLERAHKEYERRFQTIQAHPVDYFYDWLVEILANGDPQALGEYPYPSAVLRH